MEGSIGSGKAIVNAPDGSFKAKALVDNTAWAGQGRASTPQTRWPRRQRISRMRGFRHWRWHLDEVYVRVNGEMVYLWRAVDHEGEVLERYVTKPATELLRSASCARR
jgi:hypothetical protein